MSRWTAAFVAALVVSASAPASAGTIHYVYDEFGQLKSVTYPNNTAVTYSYDAGGNRSQVAAAPAVDTAPIAVDDYYNTTTNQAFYVDVLANDSDADYDPLTIQSFSENSPLIGVSIQNNQLFISASGVGAASVTYTVSDGRGGTDTATLTLDLE